MCRQLNNNQLVYATTLYLAVAFVLITPGFTDEIREHLIIDSIRRNLSEAYFDYAEKHTKSKLLAANDHAMIALESEYSLEWLISIQITGDTIDSFVLLPDGKNLRIQSIDVEKHVIKAAFDEISGFSKGKRGFAEVATDADRKPGHVLRSLSFVSGKSNSRVEVGNRLNLTPHVAVIVQTAIAKVTGKDAKPKMGS